MSIDIKNQEVRIKIKSILYEVQASLFSEEEEDNEDLSIAIPCEESISPDEIIISTEGSLKIEDGRFEVSYKESEATGMEGATTSVSFAENQPEIVSMIRSGSVSTALVFEERKRHHCVYNTPYMPFEVCVQTLHIDNQLLSPTATLDIDYLVEIRGAEAERCRLHLEIKE